MNGNIDAEFEKVPQIEVGNEGFIRAEFCSAGGKLRGKWKIMSPQGMKMGKLKAKGILKDDLVEKVQIIVEMGFDYEVAKEALRANKGDVQKAILALF